VTQLSKETLSSWQHWEQLWPSLLLASSRSPC